jgi:Na+-driven multidrug efflux pump
MAGAGATRATMLIDLAVICAFQLPLALAATAFGRASEMRLWLVVAATNCLSAAVYALSYRKGTFLQRAFTA